MTDRNLYLISQDSNNNYDTFDSAIVCAKDEEEARNIQPQDIWEIREVIWGEDYSSWCKTPDLVKVQYIGVAANEIEYGVVLASFNAG